LIVSVDIVVNKENTMPSAYENWYFDGDPDRWEREAEDAEWRKKTISPGSPRFTYDPDCSECAAGHMHDFDTHYTAQIVARQRREEEQARFIASCADDPHPF
jgi:hypothetical protein